MQNTHEPEPTTSTAGALTTATPTLEPATEAKVCYLLVLEGQGDVVSKLVDGAAWDWINRDDTAERAAADGSSWDEMDLAPEGVRLAVQEENKRYGDTGLMVTPGSADNDRALRMPKAACLYYDNDEPDGAKVWAAKTGYTIAETYEGCIY